MRPRELLRLWLGQLLHAVLLDVQRVRPVRQLMLAGMAAWSVAPPVLRSLPVVLRWGQLCGFLLRFGGK